MYRGIWRLSASHQTCEKFLVFYLLSAQKLLARGMELNKKKIESFNMKFIPHTKNFDTNMLINESPNLNLYDGSIDIKFSIEIHRPLIPNTNWRILNDDQHVTKQLQSGETSKGSIINEEQYESLLHALVSDENPELRDLLSNHIIRLESHFELQDTFKRRMNGSSRRKLRNMYSSSRPFFKMKPNKLLTS